MGQEINDTRFRREDYREFSARLRDETDLLEEWFKERRFMETEPVGGIELEAWLVDRDCRPAPLNQAYLDRLDNPLVVPELAKFNVELNTTPYPLRGWSLSLMQAELEATWTKCRTVAEELGIDIVTIGILPTVQDTELTLSNMSSMRRYRALNEQVLRLRKGRPLHLDIHGREQLEVVHKDLMLESAATSLQVHLQVDQTHAGRYYNAAKILSAPMVAICANAPFLYGKDLWDETRIPLFEQAVAVSGEGPGMDPDRVTFGKRYIDESMMECYHSNLERYDLLLPTVFDQPPERMAHLRLHNGTIWRWNRPLIGIDETGGPPHLRVEHRVVSAPTSVVDTIANTALFFGLVHFYARLKPAPEKLLGFSHARRNFYSAARRGLDADLLWLEGKTVPMFHLMRDELMGNARAGLLNLGLEITDVQNYMEIIEGRLESRQNGSAWQRAYAARHGHDMPALTRAYMENQQHGKPVHEWQV
ncbi:MAG: glutamate--cysteine ligase [Gammaproteobacteria bacterium]|nr:glutamate--cysteine ligase [Gammaproteobacteria bacterium]